MSDISKHTKEEQEELMSLKIDPIGDLRMKYINELRSRCQDLLSAYPYPEYITCDIELLRFLRGYMYNLDEATQAYRTMLTWRKEKNVDEYFKKVEAVNFDIHRLPLADAFEPYYHTNYHHKEDKEGHFLDIRLLGSINVQGMLSRTLDEWIDYNIYTLEWRIYLLNKLSKETGYLHRIFCIQDIRGVGMHMLSKKVITYMMEMSNVTSHNYPETMHKSVIINAPGIFSSIWTLVKPMMHPRTVKKFIILKSNYHEELYKYIPVQNLPVYMGGICKCEGDCICFLKNDENFSIPVSKYFTMPIEVKKGQKIIWNWKLESGNINFTASFKDVQNEKQITKQERITQHQDEYVAENDGTLSLFFDNSFSWVNGKTVIGIVTIEWNVC